MTPVDAASHVRSVAAAGDVRVGEYDRPTRPTQERTFPYGLPALPGSHGSISSRMSWVEYECFVRFEERSLTVTHKPLPDPDPATSTLRTPNMPGVGPFSPTTAPRPPAARIKNDMDLKEQSGGSVWTVEIYGGAVRAGWQPMAPALVSVGGAKAIPANNPDLGDHITYGPVRNFGVPVFSVAWQKRYTLSKPPDNLTGAPDPILFPASANDNPSADLIDFVPSLEK